MGLENDVMLSYLEDDRRFADLFNQLYFNGRQVVNAEELEEASEIYRSRQRSKKERHGDSQRIRDIKKRLKSGKKLKLLAVESQSEVNYIMPWRIMDYDCREYDRQIREAQRANIAAAEAGELIYGNVGERLCKVRKEERFLPVYTLCLYHGADAWDGPRSLRDMMDFGEDSSEEEYQEWEKQFADYPMRLVCINELTDCSGLRTSLRHLFALLPYRKDKKKLWEVLNGDSAYQQMDEETARTISVLIGIKKFGEQEEKYKTGEGEYNMCQAMEELMEDSRMEGRAEEKAKQIIEIIDNIMRELQCSLEKACKIAGKTLAEYHQAEDFYKI